MTLNSIKTYQMNTSIIGTGISGLSAACYLAQSGHQVHVYEKNSDVGGRARQFKSDGFTFDMGPSWYWMPDVFESFFADFGYQVSDFYQLKRLDPSYSVVFKDTSIDIPASLAQLYTLFESIEPGASMQLQKFLKRAKHKYEIGMGKYASLPSLSIKEFLQIDALMALPRLDILSNMERHIHTHFKHPYLRKIMEFPVLFLGAMPDRIPAMYSLMNYADASLGTWYPKGGMYRIIDALYTLAKRLGVQFHLNSEVSGFGINHRQLSSIQVQGQAIATDFVIASGDYQHMESLLPDALRNYSTSYWHSREMSPTSLIYYLGIDKRLPLSHHTLFFDSDFDAHAKALYEQPRWPDQPMFYVCAPSVTDPSVAPAGHENLFILIPLAAGLESGIEDYTPRYLDQILARMETRLGTAIRPHICYQKSYTIHDFKRDYHAYKGNAYGLANTLKQTAIGKPMMQNKKLENLLYCGQLSVPGPGVPPALLSGKIAAAQAVKYASSHILI